MYICMLFSCKKMYYYLSYRVIAWILVNIVLSSISYCTSVRVQYDTLRGTIFTNIHAITFLLYSNTYFFFRSVINTVKIWFFHISLLCCTRKQFLIFALVQYEWHSERTGIFSESYKDETNSKIQEYIARFFLD